ncbi:hypothetical protein PPO43_02005 [Saprospira sp. CCB-QB6]|uniref:hypothetical protein n=1 Tax=Saprospira sp. CCB-QB6 TaxID=3023936 RepID=UPI00234ADAA5|nr:hypothetical protein [Saprospira sp. CCB-QB6]WCL81871.1 hypothetical protein PPO43_02005 [Saprospira sp. CCB-QB6]
MSKSATNNNSQPPAGSLRIYSWAHWAISSALLMAILLFVAYLQLEEILFLKGELLQLSLPAFTGIYLTLANWNFIKKWALILLPIWLAVALAIGLLGILGATLFLSEVEPGEYWWIDFLVQILPALLSGHWLYNGYSQMSRRGSWTVYLLLLFWCVLGSLLFFSDTINFFILQAIYLSGLGSILQLIHRLGWDKT